jgi:hypothetical protein
MNYARAPILCRYRFTEERVDWMEARRCSMEAAKPSLLGEVEAVGNRCEGGGGGVGMA